MGMGEGNNEGANSGQGKRNIEENKQQKTRNVQKSKTIWFDPSFGCCMQSRVRCITQSISRNTPI